MYVFAINSIKTKTIRLKFCCNVITLGLSSQRESVKAKNSFAISYP